MSESAEISSGRLTYATLQDKLFFVKFSEQFHKSEILMMNFTLKYSVNNDFLKMIFFSCKNAVFCNFCFLLNFHFSVLWTLCHSSIHLNQLQQQ